MERETGNSATAQPNGQYLAALTLGIAPVEFSSERVRIGRLNPEEDGPIKDLRREHSRTHAFRFDSRDGRIANIGLEAGIDPLGEIEEVLVGEHLLLLGVAIEQQLRRWFSGNRKILKRFHPLICLGGRDRLLGQALRHAGVNQTDRRLDVVAKWSFDLRLLASADPDAHPVLVLIADVGTSHVIDIPVSELMETNFDPTGCYVGSPSEVDDLSGFSTLRLIGRVRKVENETLHLDDVRTDFDSDRIAAADVFVEARRETLEAVTRALYPAAAGRALRALDRTRAPYISGKGKLERIARTVDDLNRSSQNDKKNSLSLTLGDGLTAVFGPLLDQSSAQFPRMIETSRPTMLFGASGHDQHTQPDSGIKRHGPFQYAHNPMNDPTIVVLCDKAAKGRMEQFAKSLRDGIEDDKGIFSGGLVGKFRLTSVRFHFAEILTDTSDGYSTAAIGALDELPQTPALALVQVREAHKKRLSGENPYFVAKCHFMRAGVPVQAVRLETIEQDYGRAFKLNNLALGSYAKIGGVPWVISTRGVATHELVVGIGSTQVGGTRLGEWTRYVGFTTLFQGDGRYLVWETTKEATFQSYPEALLESLRKSIRFVKSQNRWVPGDNVRLVFHVYKPLKRVEIETVKQLVEELLTDYPVEFAFLDISHYHLFQIFNPTQKGVKYWSQETRRSGVKGVYVPQRGTAMLLGPRTALLQLVGAKEVKTWSQGMPRPLLLELHPDSDFSDLTYLVRQVFHFSYMSWRSFFPSHEPVTILYSRWIARMLGSLNTVSDWDSVVLNQMRDRRAMWFL
ncbi:MAG: Piwi domain-containing protein [Chloroflexi bacterium]|nr:Piwi domain-containing protein [Chloroflexota bacterium]